MFMLFFFYQFIIFYKNLHPATGNKLVSVFHPKKINIKNYINKRNSKLSSYNNKIIYLYFQDH